MAKQRRRAARTYNALGIWLGACVSGMIATSALAQAEERAVDLGADEDPTASAAPAPAPVADAPPICGDADQVVLHEAAGEPGVCCWPGQTVVAGLCIGEAQCPAGTRPTAGGCWRPVEPETPSEPQAPSPRPEGPPATGARLRAAIGMDGTFLADASGVQLAGLLPLRLEAGYRVLPWLSFSVFGYWARSVASFDSQPLDAHAAGVALSFHGSRTRARKSRGFLISVEYTPLLRYQYDGHVGADGSIDPAMRLTTQGFTLGLGKEWFVSERLALEVLVNLGISARGRLDERPELAEDTQSPTTIPQDLRDAPQLDGLSMPNFSLGMAVGISFVAGR